MSLVLSPDLTLPDEAVTQTFSILAKRGTGKTYTASVMVEEMLKEDLHVAVVDPIGVWHGLRTSADGKRPGFSIIIAGGEHGDVPLDPSNGEVIADLIVDNNLSMVIDLSLMRKHEQKRFMTDFAEALYHRNRTALHLVLDEADEFAPQRPLGDEARLLGAIEDLVRRGRARGIGVTMITQRPAVLNKNVLTQIEVLVALRLTSPQDRAAIAEWVKYHADSDQAQEMLQSLSSLPIGTAWFWSPGWLDLFKKVAIRKRETLDSSSTPKVGQSAVQATERAPVDIEELKSQLAATIEKVESEDPKVLRRRITELERQLHDRKPEVVRVEVPILTKEQMNFLRDTIPTLIEVLRPAIDIMNRPVQHIEVPEPKLYIKDLPKVSEPLAEDAVSADGELSNYAKGILDVFVQRWPMQLSRYQISTLAGRKPRSSAFSAAMKELQDRGLIRRDEGMYELTAEGQKLVDVDFHAPKPSIEETINMWRKALPAYEESLFNVLLEHPEGLTREALAEAAGKSLTSSGFSGAISSLVRNGLATSSRGVVKLADLFFEEAKA